MKSRRAYYNNAMEEHLSCQIDELKRILSRSKRIAFLGGAGTSTESGIPDFRSENGVFEATKKFGYPPEVLLSRAFFLKHPDTFFEYYKSFLLYPNAEPNDAHRALARLEQTGKLGAVITQNIDNLHQEAGNKMVSEFHGNLKKLKCLSCDREYNAMKISLEELPPTCRQCGDILKPDFVFFGESIPSSALMESYEAAGISDVFLIIGTTGEVMPANQFPPMAKANGATIIEINPEPSLYTNTTTDLFLQGKATEIMKKIEAGLFSPSLDDN